MKKIWPILLLGILLLFISCVKEEVAETDLIFEGKTYVIGSGKPPKGQPMKMLVYKASFAQGVKKHIVYDSFYTSPSGNFSFRFTPDTNPKNFLLRPEFNWRYDNLDQLVPNRTGRHQIDFRLLGYGTLRLRIKNANYSWGDSLVLIDPTLSYNVYAGPIAYDEVIDILYPAFVTLNFEIRLYRNGLESIWNENYMVHDDSIHFHEIVY